MSLMPPSPRPERRCWLPASGTLAGGRRWWHIGKPLGPRFHHTGFERLQNLNSVFAGEDLLSVGAQKTLTQAISPRLPLLGGVSSPGPPPPPLPSTPCGAGSRRQQAQAATPATFPRSGGLLDSWICCFEIILVVLRFQSHGRQPQTSHSSEYKSKTWSLKYTWKIRKANKNKI